MFTHFGKILIFAGCVLIILGVILYFFDKLPLSKLPLGRLPGDIYIKKENYTFYFPIVTCILVSAVISLIIWLLTRR